MKPAVRRAARRPRHLGTSSLSRQAERRRAVDIARIGQLQGRRPLAVAGARDPNRLRPGAIGGFFRNLTAVQSHLSEARLWESPA